MAGTHTEGAFKKLTKPELVQLLLNTEANLGAQISTPTAEVKNLEADVAMVKNANSGLGKQLIKTEWQCWENAQYSRHECL